MLQALRCAHGRAGGGKIINLSSIRGARAALGGNLAYCSSKGAVDMMTKQLAVELASKKVLVNAIGPIITVTPMTRKGSSARPTATRRCWSTSPWAVVRPSRTSSGRAVFLASPASDFVTGTILYPDGGTMALCVDEGSGRNRGTDCADHEGGPGQGERPANHGDGAFVVRALAKGLTILGLFDAENREWTLDEISGRLVCRG